MDKFNLLPDESLILKAESVCHGNFGLFTNDLYLTNRSLVFVEKGLFGKIKNEQRFPLSQIKIYNGKPQAFMVTKPGGTVQLDVYFRDSIETFGFNSNSGSNRTKKQVSNWIDAIYETVTGRKKPINNTFEEDDDEDDDTIIGIFKEIGRDVIGIKPKKKTTVPAPQIEYVSKKCISCLAPISGQKGELVRCEYCDTDQVL